MLVSCWTSALSDKSLNDLTNATDRANTPVSVANEENVVGGCAAIVLINGVRGTALVASVHHDYPTELASLDTHICHPTVVGVTGVPHKTNVLTLGVEAGR